MSNGLSIELYEYLRLCGLSEKEIESCNESTRMYHDLGLYGEIAEAYLEVLAEHFFVDLSDFEFEKFFPTEFDGKRAITRFFLWIVPFAGGVARRRGKWRPLTLEMVDRTIRAKRWEEGGFNYESQHAS